MRIALGVLGVLALGACGATGRTLSRGPRERFGVTAPARLVEPSSTLSVTVFYATPSEPRPDTPAWLAEIGEAMSGQGRITIAVDARGEASVPGCEPLAVAGGSVEAAGAAIQTCAERYVDHPQIMIEATFPASAITVARYAWSMRREYVPGMTLVQVLTLAGDHFKYGSEAAVRSQRVHLLTGDGRAFEIDVWAIVTAEAPDVPMRAGDRVVIEAL